MPNFQYRAIDRAGQTVRGKITASSPQTATQILAKEGKFVDELKPSSTLSDINTVAATTYKLKLSAANRVEFLSQLAIALESQLPLMTALRVVGQQNPQNKTRLLTSGLAEIIKSGQSLSYAMAHYPAIFDKLHLSMVAAGENTGQLGLSVAQLADLAERDLETKNNIMTASLYPAFVLCLGLISVTIVVTWILPQVLTTLAADANILPLPTRMVLAISHFLRNFGVAVVIAMTLAYLLFNRWKKTPGGRYFLDSVKLRIPVFGPMQRKWAICRFANTLGTLINGGITILDALQVVRNTLGNEALARRVDEIARQVRTGSTLAEPMRNAGCFPPLLVQIVSVGQETGGLAELLLRGAKALDKEATVAIKRFMAIFPAVLILILSLIVGFIVAATLLPIVQLETAIPAL